MEFLTELWLPILLSAVFVFVASSLVHMVFGYHKSDYRELPGEEKIGEAFRAQQVPPGDYVMPFCTSMKDLAEPGMVEKYQTGPVGLITLKAPGPISMNRELFQWFLYTILVGTCVAYVAWITVAPGADYMHVMRIVGTVATLVYGLGHMPNSIWKGSAWSTSIKFLIDGVIYGLLTGGTFGWLWPGA